jgi:hypothetical protein
MLAETGDLPDGLFGDLAVQPCFQKYFRFRLTQITSTTLAIPPHKRGVGHRHERGAGCGGRGSVLRARGSQGGFFESG